MTRQEIDILWQRALVAAIAEGEPMTRYHFAEMLLSSVRDSRTENAPLEPVKTLASNVEREAFIAKAKYLGYPTMQGYITAQAQMYDVPLDVARSCFQVGSYPEAFTGFLQLLREYKMKKGDTKCYQD